jgi:tetratricopeptide (TPR) repeat protein
VKVWDSTSGQELLSLKGHTGPVQGVCFSPDGTRLASAGGAYNKPGEVKVWDSTSGQELLSLKGHTGMVVGVCFNPDGTRLASGSLDQTVKVWESRPASPDALRKRALVEKVDALFPQLLLKERVLPELRKDTWLSKADRRFALQVARNHTENLAQLNDAAWNVVRARGLHKELYAQALRQAEAAVEAAPDNGYYLNTLGVARYRVGDYANALHALTQSEKLNWTKNGPQPADVAFLAMAQHQLGKKDEAKATLARLREIMKQPGWANNADAQGFLRETETLINGGQPGQE